MCSTVTRKTGSATLMIDNFSQQSKWKEVHFKIGNYSSNYFGMRPSAVIYEDAYLFIYLQNFEDTFKFRANVSILNSEGEKLFTKEFCDEFTLENYEFHCSLVPCWKLFSPDYDYLENDKLILLCEIEVIEEEQENQKTAGAISKDFNNLSENLQSLLTDGKFADATLIVGLNGKEFHVHKNILAARSPVFAAMFEHDCEEKGQNKVNITDMDEEVCAEMLSFVYSGKVKGLDRYAMELLVAADKYLLHSLKSICEQYMCNQLTVESVSNVLILADMHQATDLKSKCIEYICAHGDQVESTDGWKQLDTKATLLKELFSYLAKKK